jgi:hypothetical protein
MDGRRVPNWITVGILKLLASSFEDGSDLPVWVKCVKLIE